MVWSCNWYNLTLKQSNSVTNITLCPTSISTNLVKLTPIDTNTSDAVTQKFKLIWLAWYPCLIQVIHDDSNNFIGYIFTFGLQTLGGKHVLSIKILSLTLSANMSQTVMALIKTCYFQGCHTHNIFQLVDNDLANTMYSIWCTIYTILQASSGALVLSSDVLLNTSPYKGDKP